MSSPAEFDEESWRERLHEGREAKAAHFRDAERSPLPPDRRGEDFPGLAFFDPDPDYRYVLELRTYEDPESITVETTADGEQTYRRVGEFRFEIDVEPVSLQAYQPTDESDRLWVPFRDATNGEETYPAGRYVDLEPEAHHTDAGWVLDLNTAYNPTCAYNTAYECPLIPTENWLEVRVEAGEQDFPAEPADPEGFGH